MEIIGMISKSTVIKPINTFLTNAWRALPEDFGGAYKRPVPIYATVTRIP